MRSAIGRAGHAVLSYLHIPPSHLSLIASTPATEDPTPVPSPRSSSPVQHGLVRFTAAGDGFGPLGRGFLDDPLETGEVSDAETEHPDAPALPPSSPRAHTHTHGESVLFAPPSPTGSTFSAREAAAWGGEFDSLEFALSYWRGFLRRLGVFDGRGRRGAEEEDEAGDAEERCVFLILRVSSLASLGARRVQFVDVGKGQAKRTDAVTPPTFRRSTRHHIVPVIAA